MTIFIRNLFILICLGILTGCGNGEDMDDQLLNQDENSDTEIEQDFIKPSTPKEDVDSEPERDEIVIENEAFKIYEPAPNVSLQDETVVRGLARVFEGTVQYALEDGHYIYDKGFTTANNGGPEWGEFEIVIDLEDVVDGEYRVVLFEYSAKDNSVIHELIIPIHIKK